MSCKIKQIVVFLRIIFKIQSNRKFPLAIIIETSIAASSCMEYYLAGVRKNGLYEILDQTATQLQVYCDFESEANSVWTLVTSYSFKNINSFRLPYLRDNPRNEMLPNWKDYR